jgi:restriction system protein
MSSMYPYHVTVRNQYLGVSKIIRAMTENELQWLIDTQRAKWDEQEKRKREQKQKEAEREAAQRETESLRAQAELDTKAAQQHLEAFRNILRESLRRNLAFDWDQILDCSSFAPFQFKRPKPDRDQVRRRLLGPEPQEAVVPAPVLEVASVWEFLLPFLRSRRLEREAAAEEAFEAEKMIARADFAKRLKQYRAREKEVLDAYNAQVREHNAILGQAKTMYIRERKDFLARQEAHNKAILAFRSRYEKGSPEAVERYVQMALERSTCPEGVTGDPDVQFDGHSNTLVINLWLPGLTDVPRVLEYSFIASRKAIKPVELKRKEFEALYDDIIHQIALRTVHEVFVADYATQVEAVVFNGWVRGTDRKTGKPFTSCILSCEAPRKQFMEFDLAHVSPKDCVRGLKGITAGPLAMLAPVKPIMEINREDDRFIESREVLEGLRPVDNLAAMEWEDFEHLIRELFEREFVKTGGEVKVTQASRDRGVDAIAFDPDPIRGGKFVIQAKRYNVVVPVSAVRDLYGTMIAEGASKGILVTTSHYGRDSREFAKDKPIALIDGENLVHMFHEHGYNLHIALLPKGDPRRGVGQSATG